jgi:hypothetical protein
MPTHSRTASQEAPEAIDVLCPECGTVFAIGERCPRCPPPESFLKSWMMFFIPPPDARERFAKCAAVLIALAVNVAALQKRTEFYSATLVATSFFASLATAVCLTPIAFAFMFSAWRIYKHLFRFSVLLVVTGLGTNTLDSLLILTVK